ncbi:Uma2 family endonuclease [Streptomyces olivoreticuli]|uniref:Uma2 family endonuclease n=1 Tax=Streptomyces olivoreticuli TaxID=68246 RepID=UPI00265847CC|nr:Uma2 family endonuclease [Streptomyces olivoreticuli]WKK21985.1 Uma2 family endonuclease [Streptomyces olivoreticuli]
MTAVYERMNAVFLEHPEIFEGFKIELLRGNIVMMAGPDRVHNMIVESVVDQIPRDHWHRMQTQDLAIPGEDSEPQPDLVVIERGAFEGPGRLIPAAATTLLMEVVSKYSAHTDYRIKRAMYAAGRVPAYLVVDPFAAKCLLLTNPVGVGEEADYRTEQTSKFGEPVPLGTLGVSLDTSEFQTMPGTTR